MKKIESKSDIIIKDRPYVWGLLIGCLILVIYLPALDVYLRGDDFEWLNQSYSIWQHPAVMFQKINHFFRPLIKLSYLLNYTFFETQVLYYNLTNIFIHLINVFLLYILIFRITGKSHIAVLTTLAYGTSPIYSEAVLWTAGRVDSVLLTFMLGVLLLFNDDDEKKSRARNIVIILLTLCALGSKETWILLPFLVFSFLLVVKKNSFKTALKKTFPLFCLLVIYIGYFIVFPLLFGQSFPPTAYARLGIAGAIHKFGLLITEYMGLSDYFSGAFWEHILIILLLTGLVYRFIRTKNRLALWGLAWMLITISISLPIAYAPSRYNYIPLVGFWMMLIAFLSGEIGKLKQRLRINRLTTLLAAGIALSLLLTLQVNWLQREIKDYRIEGIPHKTIVDMYQGIKDKLPHDRPIIFVDLSKRKAEHEFIGNLNGYEKVLFIREKAIWELVYLSPLANFVGDPFKEMMKPIVKSHLQAVFFADYAVLVFTDDGFFISDMYKSQLQEYFQDHGKLPYKVEALHFVPVRKNM